MSSLMMKSAINTFSSLFPIFLISDLSFFPLYRERDIFQKLALFYSKASMENLSYEFMRLFPV